MLRLLECLRRKKSSLLAIAAAHIGNPTSISDSEPFAIPHLHCNPHAIHIGKDYAMQFTDAVTVAGTHLHDRK